MIGNHYIAKIGDFLVVEQLTDRRAPRNFKIAEPRSSLIRDDLFLAVRHFQQICSATTAHDLINAARGGQTGLGGRVRWIGVARVSYVFNDADQHILSQRRSLFERHNEPRASGYGNHPDPGGPRESRCFVEKLEYLA